MATSTVAPSEAATVAPDTSSESPTFLPTQNPTNDNSTRDDSILDFGVVDIDVNNGARHLQSTQGTASTSTDPPKTLNSNDTEVPSARPTRLPSGYPSFTPTALPSDVPTAFPTFIHYDQRVSCSDIIDEQIPGSNLYLAAWICFFASFNITLRWKAAQAIQFAQAQNMKAAEKMREDEEDDENDDKNNGVGDNDVDDDDDLGADDDDDDL